jgi:hypothetical protein
MRIFAGNGISQCGRNGISFQGAVLSGADREEPMSFDGLTERETADVQARRWWSAEELDASEETFFADHLPQRIRAALHAGEWELPLPI